MLEHELNVTRRVTVMGHPAFLPQIDAHGAVRAFHVLVRAIGRTHRVRINRSTIDIDNPATRTRTQINTQAGGYLDLRFVRVRQGGGITRDRYGTEGMDLPSKVVEIRGGGVAIERGALGGSFLGVTFIAVYNTPESVQSAIAATMAGTGGRVYGGHVFVMDGDVQFTACNFWDTTLVVPVTDQVGVQRRRLDGSSDGCN